MKGIELRMGIALEISFPVKAWILSSEHVVMFSGVAPLMWLELKRKSAPIWLGFRNSTFKLVLLLREAKIANMAGLMVPHNPRARELKVDVRLVVSDLIMKH